MPKKDNETFICINHPEITMDKRDIKLILPAIVKSENTENDANVDFDNGLILVSYRCPECAYIELYNPNEPI